MNQPYILRRPSRFHGKDAPSFLRFIELEAEVVSGEEQNLVFWKIISPTHSSTLTRTPPNRLDK